MNDLTQFVVAEQTQIASAGDIRALMYDPTRVLGLPSVEPEPFTLTPYQTDSLPALLCHMTGIGIKQAKPLCRVGRVLSFDVTPAAHPDPALLYVSSLT